MDSLPKTPWQRQMCSDPKLAGKILLIKNEEIAHAANSYEEARTLVKDPSSYIFFKVPRNLDKIKIRSFKLKKFENESMAPLILNPVFPF